MRQAYLVYPGLGKTTLAKKNDLISDIETKIFKDASLKQYIGTKDYPNYRGASVNEINPEWPNNLYQYAQNEIKNGCILVSVPKKDSYDMLNVLNIQDYAFIMPDNQRLVQLRQDYINRGDDEAYIKRNLTDRYNAVLKDAHDQGKEVIFIKKGEYLTDILK